MTFGGFKSFLKFFVFLYFFGGRVDLCATWVGEILSANCGAWILASAKCMGCPEGVEWAWRKENPIFEQLSMRRYSQIFSFLSNSLSSQSYSRAKCSREDQKLAESPKWGLQSAVRVQDWEPEVQGTFGSNFWMGHLELDYEANIWWFCSTHEYYKTTKYELPTPTLSAPSSIPS